MAVVVFLSKARLALVVTALFSLCLTGCATPAVEFSRTPSTSATIEPYAATFEPFEAQRITHHPALGAADDGHDVATAASPLTHQLARSPAAATAVLWWTLYKQTYSRIDGSTCEFSPSCSRFGLDAVNAHGIFGLPMTFARLLRHHDHDFYPRQNNLLLDPVTNYAGWHTAPRLDAIATHADPARGWYEHLQATARLQWSDPSISDTRFAAFPTDAPPDDAPVGAEVREEDLQPADLDSYIAMQAAMEARLGTALFRQGDDYRAITALKRYQLLDGSDEASYLSHLMIGEVYRRNGYAPLALRQFEQAILYAPDPVGATFGYLLGLQEICLSLAIYGECYLRLLELEAGELDPALRELVHYQKLYAEVVLRAPSLGPDRAEVFSDPLLRAHALDLLDKSAAFERLPVKHPWLAGILSGAIPGAGQAYNGRWLDGAIALGFNLLFGAATYYSAVHLDSLPLTIASGALTTGFYTGNILNAVIDARRINAGRIHDFFDTLAHDHWPRVGFTIDDGEVDFDYTFDWPGEGRKGQ